MQPLEWLLFAVESAVLIVGLLHIYMELRKKKKTQTVRIIFWRIEQNPGVEKEKNGKK